MRQVEMYHKSRNTMTDSWKICKTSHGTTAHMPPYIGFGIIVCTLSMGRVGPTSAGPSNKNIWNENILLIKLITLIDYIKLAEGSVVVENIENKQTRGWLEVGGGGGGGEQPPMLKTSIGTRFRCWWQVVVPARERSGWLWRSFARRKGFILVYQGM